jgi:acetyl-CoA carboxylase biotin carboxyl carrier protein
MQGAETERTDSKIMEFEQVIQLIDHVSAAGLSAFSYEAEGVKLSMKGRQVIAGNVQAAMPTMAGQSDVIPASVSGNTMPDTIQGAGTAAPSGKVVNSPLVGTFYAAPSEDAAPYIQVGDTVKKGQILAIVEAMKLMNEIESDYDGVVKEILVKDGEPVEYGQPLFCLE